jgi:hypothetical protein
MHTESGNVVDKYYICRITSLLGRMQSVPSRCDDTERPDFFEEGSKWLRLLVAYHCWIVAVVALFAFGAGIAFTRLVGVRPDAPTVDGDIHARSIAILSFTDLSGNS